MTQIYESVISLFFLRFRLTFSFIFLLKTLNETSRDNRKMATQQRLALYFENFARKKILSRSTVVEISRSRSLFEALKTLGFKKFISKSKKFRERRKSINFHHNMCYNSLQFHRHI